MGPHNNCITMASHRIFLLFIASLNLFGCSAYMYAVGHAKKARHFPSKTLSICRQRKMTSRASLATCTNAQRLHTVALSQSDSSAADAAAVHGPSQVSNFIRRLNSNTKWLVTIGNTAGVWSRPHSYQGPFIIAGAIAAVYFTDVLKKMINQSRPDTSVLVDPGMPSSHSLVSFFLAVGWIGAIGASGLVGNAEVIGKISLAISAATVAVLRVVCGYHSWAQIGVGAVLGSAMGQAWVMLGRSLHLHYPKTLHDVSWALYLAGSALFIKTNISKWHREHKHH